MLKYILIIEKIYWNFTMNLIIHLSFTSRLRLSILTLSLVLLSFFIYYTYQQNKLLLIENLQTQEQLNVKHTIHIISLELNQLARESYFLAQLSVMNDMITKDIDKRILKLLEAKKKTLKFDVDFAVYTQDGELAVATYKKKINKNNYITFMAPIYSSLKPNQALGAIKIYLNVKELMLYTKVSPYISIELAPKKEIENKNKFIFYLRKTVQLEEDKLLIVTDTVPSNILNKQLTVLKRNLILLSFTTLFLLYFFATFLSRRISSPIRQLSTFIEKLSTSQDYTLRCTITRRDEIGLLSQSFNKLLSIIQTNFKYIEQESKQHMQQYTHLVNSLSQITQLTDKKELDKVVQEITTFAQGKDHNVFINSISTLAKLKYESIELQEMQTRLLENATQLAKNRSLLIAQISHEFKTPLNSIIGFSQFINQERLLSNQYKKVSINIEKSGRHLLQMVNNVLEVGQKEEIKTALNIKLFNLTNLVQEVCELLEPQAQTACIKIHFKYSETHTILSDTRILKQVLLNLIANAIKFSNHKDIIIQIKKRKNKLSIHVIDQGIGMSQNSIHKLFNPFSRLANASGIQGTGLGLALAQNYMRRLGGKIIATSAGLNKGSEFIIKVNI